MVACMMEMCADMNDAFKDVFLNHQLQVGLFVANVCYTVMEMTAFFIIKAELNSKAATFD